MSRVVIIAEFVVKPGELPAFLAAVADDARDSLALENGGCLAFDVLRPQAGGDQVVLHEVYRDAAALEAHRQMPHYQTFKQASAPLVEALKVQVLEHA